SDHGFTSFHTGVHLNRWLADNNYLFLTDHNTESGGFFENVDWEKTKAYAVGFGGIFLNKKGREARGIVREEEFQRLKQSIADGLRGLKDPSTTEAVVRSVYDGEETFKGSRNSHAPDLYVGFNAGYRASWQTALGAVPPVVMEKNQKRWNGDHLVDPALVPGVIFSNKKMISGRIPDITDVAVTVLDLFPGKTSVKLDGKNLFKNVHD
ncbi:MAG: nucleotide pyrophosphatase, partial [Candidatus Omnitrophica bacterium]|nr:nucleotide pyrophosphatase [Candidatus Omnitrophota bacterium]